MFPAASEADSYIAALERDIKAEQEGALELRIKGGALPDETLPDLVDRLIDERDTWRDRAITYRTGLVSVARVAQCHAEEKP